MASKRRAHTILLTTRMVRRVSIVKSLRGSRSLAREMSQVRKVPSNSFEKDSSYTNMICMKTTIDIPEDLLKDLMNRTSASTKREAVIMAIVEYNQRRRMGELTSVLGTFTDFMDRTELDAEREAQ